MGPQALCYIGPPKLLGHADIKLTLGTYSHFLSSRGDYAANAMERALS
jgi:hypothetical protein